MRTLLKRWTLVQAIAVVAACAAPPPAEIQGPAAYITDSWSLDADGATQLFVVTAIDGKPVKNTIETTRLASQKIGGRPFQPTVDLVGRKVSAKSARFTLKGTHATRAPIQELFKRGTGTFFETEGVVEFSPEPDGLYAVKGQLQKEGSAVWIVDINTNQVVTQKVTN